MGCANVEADSESNHPGYSAKMSGGEVSATRPKTVYADTYALLRGGCRLMQV